MVTIVREQTAVLMSACPFCELIKSGTLGWEAEHAVAFPDRYPISPGHTLVVPRLHIGDLFSLDGDHRAAAWALVDRVVADLAASHSPDGFNIGANVGAPAGQTVDHAHIHVIPRYVGDRPDPRGGVRWVLPENADYWS